MVFTNFSFLNVFYALNANATHKLATKCVSRVGREGARACGLVHHWIHSLSWLEKTQVSSGPLWGTSGGRVRFVEFQNAT